MLVKQDIRLDLSTAGNNYKVSTLLVCQLGLIAVDSTRFWVRRSEQFPVSSFFYW